MGTNLKINAVSYGGATVGPPLLFECKAFTIDCCLMLRTRNFK